MKKSLYTLVIIAVLAYGFIQQQEVSVPDTSTPANRDTSVQYAFENRQSDLQIQGEGIVSKILPDDVEGSRHQKFILRLAGGTSLLIAHNIDLAPRIRDLNKGDTVEFNGEYEWNSKGGVLHWTHDDPAGRHIGGWLKHQGQTYR